MRVERLTAQMAAVAAALAPSSGSEALEIVDEVRASFDADLNGEPGASGSSDDERIEQLRREAGVA